MTRTTVQIVEIVDGRERHVRKFTTTLPASTVLAGVETLLGGHLVTAKKRGSLARDRGQKKA